MFKWLKKKIIKNPDDILLFKVTFSLNKYKQNGKENSCNCYCRSELKDEFIKITINNLVDYIRNNYDMEKLSLRKIL
jgi:hypothetical protein